MTELIPSGLITNGQFIRGQWGWVEDVVSSVTVRGDQTPQGERRHESSSGHDLNLLSVWPASLSGLSECLFSLLSVGGEGLAGFQEPRGVDGDTDCR